MDQVLADDEQALQKAEAARRGRKETGQPDDDEAGEADSEDGESWRWGSREAEIVRVEFLDGEGKERRSFNTGDTLVARIRFMAHQPIKAPLFGVALHHADGLQICGPNTEFSEYPIEAIEGDGYLDFVIPRLPLLQGTFLFSAAIYDAEGQHAYDHHHMAYTLRVRPSKETQERYGAFYIPSHWQLDSTSAAQSSAPQWDL
jgi:hypothetical protein